jgi:hypothetical protein
VEDVNITMIERGPLLVEGNDADAHRGVWFYETAALQEPIQVGDIVEFTLGCSREIVQRGTVTEARLDPRDFPKFCSRVNDRGFRWKEV